MLRLHQLLFHVRDVIWPWRKIAINWPWTVTDNLVWKLLFKNPNGSLNNDMEHHPAVLLISGHGLSFNRLWYVSPLTDAPGRIVNWQIVSVNYSFLLPIFHRDLICAAPVFSISLIWIPCKREPLLIREIVYLRINGQIRIPERKTLVFIIFMKFLPLVVLVGASFLNAWWEFGEQ